MLQHNLSLEWQIVSNLVLCKYRFVTPFRFVTSEWQIVLKGALGTRVFSLLRQHHYNFLPPPPSFRSFSTPPSPPFSSSFPSPQWGIFDAEIKVSSVETPEWRVLPLKPGVGQNTAIHASPRNFLLSNFSLSRPFNFIFSKAVGHVKWQQAKHAKLYFSYSWLKWDSLWWL